MSDCPAAADARRLICPAPAKINLALHVVGRRADGYHLLETVFRLVDFADTLTFTLREDGALTRSRGPAGVAPDDDLALRAARLLRRETGAAAGVDIAIDKRVPLGGGLGGGSSDAATTLLALNRLWRLDLTRAALQQMALRLGADVPFFVYGRNALGRGIGERLTALELPPAWYLILLPGVAVPTAEVFEAHDLTRNSPSLTIAPLSPQPGRNDLEPVVRRRFPEVARHLEWLSGHARAALSGSGSSVFAAFAREADARAVHAQLPAGMTGVVARGLDRHPLAEFARD